MKTKKARFLIFCLITLGILTVQLIATTRSDIAYERPEPYFKITLLAPTNNAYRVLAAQVIARELWKIGIDAELVLIGWDALGDRLFSSVDFEGYEGDGFDIGFVGWSAPFNVIDGLQSFRSANIDKTSEGVNYYPINDSKLDTLIEKIGAEQNSGRRREYVRQALDILVWQAHPTTGLYHSGRVVAQDAALRDFASDPTSTYVSWGEAYFEDDAESELVVAMGQRFSNLHIGESLFDGFFSAMIAGSALYDNNLDGIIQPILAAGDPHPIGSNDVIADLIDPATIAADSPYKTQTVWGPNPNIDASQHNATVVAANYSMFLIPLREGIPWQPGYGYTADMKLNATADDLLWTWSYLMNEEVPRTGSVQASISSFWGSDYTRAFEKINDTLVKANFRGPTGNGIVMEWHSLLVMLFSPRHILDPTFDATPYGGAVGVTPDGTRIVPHAEKKRYRFNTGEGDRPYVNTGPYYLERWDESTQMAIYRKFDDWGGYGNSSLWHDPRFERNNIDTVGIRVIPTKEQAMLALENGKVDDINRLGMFNLNSDIQYLRSCPDIQVHIRKGAGIQTIGYNTRHPKLDDRYVRLAISHLVPRDRFVSFLLSGIGQVNEVVGVPRDSPYYPYEEEWQSLGLDPSENVEDPLTGREIKFQGHIRYNLTKAWALMEKAGYPMTPFRDAIRREEEGERAERGLEPFPILLASAGTIALVGAALILGRRYWQQYVVPEPEALQASRQRKRIMKAMALKKSPRMSEKAQAQELFQQLANDTSLSPELTLYAMLNLSDMLLDEARAYGEQKVLDDAERLSTRIYSIAQHQESGSVLVEALLLRSKFVLLEGNITKADNLLKKASSVAIEKRLPKLAAKVAQEQATLAKEVSRWEVLTTQAAPLRERLEQARLQDYIASAVRIIELEEALP